uniref:Phospholipid:diacylglycerol acyltransferase n=1 Tax=Vitrella brassicaformis TaxID=1169539 RepID=A0A7S1KJ47_9ALVE
MPKGRDAKADKAGKDEPSPGDAASSAAASPSPKKPRGVATKRWFVLSTGAVGAIVAVVVAVWAVMPKERVEMELKAAEMKKWLDSTLQPWFNTSSPLPLERRLKDKGIKAKHPVLFVPGLVSSQLEVWNALECFGDDRRWKIWGGVDMFTAVLQNTSCWLEHLTLDEKTGLDPYDGAIKMRAQEGFASVDYFFPGFWVWGKLTEVLGSIGYDPNSLMTMSWDWRPSFDNLEVRDRLLTKMKRRIEDLYEFNGKQKVVLVSHSLGSLLTFFFFQWVTYHHDPKWVDKHIHSWVNIAGALLGVNKSTSCLFSGEMKDLNIFGPVIRYIIDKILPLPDRVRLWRSMGTMRHMIPKGGARVWGHLGEPTFMKFPASPELDLPFDDFVGWANSYLDKAADLNTWLDKDTYVSMPPPDQPLPTFRDASDAIKYWLNPLAAPLPYAPNMKVFCTYGVGIPTERNYLYQKMPATHISNHNQQQPTATDQVLTSDQRLVDLPVQMIPPHQVSGLLANLSSATTSARDAWEWPPLASDPRGKVEVLDSVVVSDGDVSVPLESLGLMCQLWRNTKRYNPSGAAVRVREVYHNISMTQELMRDSKSGNHVDILGNEDILELVARVASGDDPTDERTFSLIQEIAHKVVNNEFT